MALTYPFLFSHYFASVIFGWQGSLFAWIATMLLMLPRIFYLAYNSTTLFTNIFCLLVPLLFMLILTIQITGVNQLKISAMEREKKTSLHCFNPKSSGR
jgi:hypothetical protein